MPMKAMRMPALSNRRSTMPAVGPTMQLRPPYIKVERKDTLLSILAALAQPREYACTYTFIMATTPSFR